MAKNNGDYMKPDSKTWKRLSAGIAGLLYAGLYGFWTMLATGGGHVNFIWLFLFLFAEFFGLYFPLMAVLAVDLRRRFTQIIFGGLIAFNLIVSSVLIYGWITEPGSDRPSDFSRTVRANGYGGVIVYAAVHFLPTIIFAVFLILATARDKPASSDDSSISLRLS